MRNYKLKHAQYYLAAVSDKKYTEAQKNVKLYQFFNEIEDASKVSTRVIEQFVASLHSYFILGDLPEFDRVIEIEGIKYGLDPSIENMETGAFLDLDKLVQGEIDQNLHKAIAILYRPTTLKIGDRYEVEGYVEEKSHITEQREKLFLEHFDYKQALGVISFFWNSTRNSLHS